MSQRFFHVVAFGAYRAGIEVLNSYPHHEWLASWLRDEVVKRKGAGGAEAEAHWLAGRISDSFPDRTYFAEIQRSDRLGHVRIEGRSPSREALKQ